MLTKWANELDYRLIKELWAFTGNSITVRFAHEFLYVKTKNFHWHISGAHFRDYHRLLDDHGSQIFGVTDALAERIRKLGGTTIRSVVNISRPQRVLDNDAPFVTPLDMLAELREDNTALAGRLRQTHGLCDDHGDIASASLLETWIDEAQARAWFLYEMTHHAEAAGHWRTRFGNEYGIVPVQGNACELDRPARDMVVNWRCHEPIWKGELHA